VPEERDPRLALDFRQATEGVLMDAIRRPRAQAAGAGGRGAERRAYTHTSVAIMDAIKGAGVTLIEVHISNVHAREAFRHHSYISPVAKAVMPAGIKGYASHCRLAERPNSRRPEV
jgi:3-dehydroquinate dehydratase-2